MANDFLESLTKNVGSVSDIITRSAQTYDAVRQSFDPADDPYWWEGQQATKGGEPPKTQGVETAQAKASDHTGLVVLAVLAFILLKVL